MHEFLRIYSSPKRAKVGGRRKKILKKSKKFPEKNTEHFEASYAWNIVSFKLFLFYLQFVDSSATRNIGLREYIPFLERKNIIRFFIAYKFGLTSSLFDLQMKKLVLSIDCTQFTAKKIIEL